MTALWLLLPLWAASLLALHYRAARRLEALESSVQGLMAATLALTGCLRLMASKGLPEPKTDEEFPDDGEIH